MSGAAMRRCGTTTCCDRINSFRTIAVGRFQPDGPIGFRAASGGPLRATRADAERDEHHALSPSCAVVVEVRR